MIRKFWLAIAAISAAVVLAGGIMQTFQQLGAVVTVPSVVTATLTIAAVWAGIGIYARRYGIKWVFSGKHRNVRRLGFIPNVATAGAILCIWSSLLFRPREPEIEVRWYETNPAGALRLVDRPRLTLGTGELHSGQIRLPINLAVRNADREELRATRVEITYPEWLRVRPTGRPQIDTTGRTLIYEHDVGELPPVHRFTPLRTIDTLLVEMEIDVSPGVALLGDGVPIYWYTILSWPRPREFTLGIRVFTANKRPLSGLIVVKIDVTAKIAVVGSDNAKEIAPSAADSAVFRSSEPLDTLHFWTGHLQSPNPGIEYLEFRTHTSTYQRISVSGTPRSVYVDSDSDGYIERHVWDSNGDGLPDGGVQFRPARVPMLRWERAALE